MLDFALMKGKERRFTELSSLKYAMYTAPLPAHSKRQVLLIQFAGDFRKGAEGNTDGLFMAAMTKAALAAWSGWGLILDLRKLRYHGGESIVDALTAGNDEWEDAPYPTRVVVSNACLKGLTVLLEDKIAEDPDDWLFDSPEQALASIESHHELHKGHARYQLG